MRAELIYEPAESGDESDAESEIIPLEPKRPMAHKGRKRRRFTEEMVRCARVAIVHGRELPCGALLWKSDAARMRGHLEEEHGFKLDDLLVLDDDRVLQLFTTAEIIRIDGINDDDEIPPDEDEDDEIEIDESDPADPEA